MEKNSKLSLIIAAAGNAKRLNKNISKQFLEIGNKPLLYLSIEKFLNLKNLLEVIVVTNDISETKKIIDNFQKKELQIKIVLGGKSRKESVQNGFLAIKSNPDLVIIHDVARPFFSLKNTEKCIDKASEFGAAILASPVKDTLKKYKLKDNNILVEKTIDRNELYAVQTPQIFSYEVLKNAYKFIENINIKDEKITDEATIVELLGKDIAIVEGSSGNIKITYPEDILIAEAMIKNQIEGNKIYV